jgi:hypothetical protein
VGDGSRCNLNPPMDCRGRVVGAERRARAGVRWLIWPSGPQKADVVVLHALLDAGTWESPAPFTKIPEPTTTPNSDQTEPGSGPSTSLKPWATASRSTKPRSAQRRAASPYVNPRVSRSTSSRATAFPATPSVPCPSLLLPRRPAPAHLPTMGVLRRLVRSAQYTSQVSRSGNCCVRPTPYMSFSRVSAMDASRAD